MFGWMSEDKNSMLQLLIMSTLSDDGRTAGELIDLLADSFRDLWIPRRGSIYPAINQLVDKGLLEKTNQRPMIIRLTSKGAIKFPQMVSDLINYLQTFFEFIDIFQENLSEISNTTQNLRYQFLKDFVKLLKENINSFETSFEESKHKSSGWTDVSVK